MNQIDLTKGNITKSLLIVAIPSMISMLLQFSYNIIDMYFLGLYDPTGKVISAVGTASLYISFAYAINFLTAMGMGIRTSQKLGQGKEDEFHKYVNNGIVLTFIIAVLTFIVLFFFTTPLISFSNISDPETRLQAEQYLKIFSVTLLFYFFNTAFNRVMASMGKSDSALKISAVGVVINIALDYLFIIHFSFGIVGAGVASLIGNVVVLFLYVVCYKDVFVFKRKYGLELSYFKDIIKLGLPYTLQRILFSVVGLYMAKFLISFGDEIMASQKLGLQIESVTLMVIGGLLTAMSAFAGQNYGAGQYDRIRKGFNSAVRIGILYSLCTSVLFFIYGEDIVRLFVQDDTVVKYAVYYLKIIALGQPFAVLEMVGNGLYNGIGKPVIPSAISIIITPLRLVFAAILMPIGAVGVFIGILITTIMKGCVSFGIYYFRIRKTLHND